MVKSSNGIWVRTRQLCAAARAFALQHDSVRRHAPRSQRSRRVSSANDLRKLAKTIVRFHFLLAKLAHVHIEPLISEPSAHKHHYLARLTEKRD